MSSNQMRTTVCQLSNDRRGFESGWRELCAHVKGNNSDLVLLPEMPFSNWFADKRDFDAAVWDRAVTEHRTWKQRLADLSPATVITTEPVLTNGRRFNEAYAC